MKKQFAKILVFSFYIASITWVFTLPWAQSSDPLKKRNQVFQVPWLEGQGNSLVKRGVQNLNEYIIDI